VVVATGRRGIRRGRARSRLGTCWPVVCSYILILRGRIMPLREDLAGLDLSAGLPNPFVLFSSPLYSIDSLRLLIRFSEVLRLV
jgi:hypothetical protein